MSLKTAALFPKGTHAIRADLNGRGLILFVKIDKFAFNKLKADLDGKLKSKNKSWISQTIEERNSAGRLIRIAWDAKVGVVARIKITSTCKGLICPNFKTDCDLKLLKLKGGMLQFPPKIRGGKKNPCRPIALGSCAAHFSAFPSFKA